MHSTSSFNLDQAAYPITQLPDGIRVEAPVSKGKLVGRKRPDGSYRRQCGEYVNDAIGIPSYFGDTLASKTRRIAKGAPLAPGSAGVMDTGTKWGHVFLCERVLEPGKRFIISESNPFDTETFRRFECTLNDLHKRGFIGCTRGLNMTAPDPKVSSWAEGTFKKLEALGFSRSNPQTPVSPERLRHIFVKLGFPVEDNDKPLNYEQMMHMLDKAGVIDMVFGGDLPV
jgi:hypothetical protein